MGLSAIYDLSEVHPFWGVRRKRGYDKGEPKQLDVEDSISFKQKCTHTKFLIHCQGFMDFLIPFHGSLGTPGKEHVADLALAAHVLWVPRGSRSSTGGILSAVALLSDWAHHSLPLSFKMSLPDLRSLPKRIKIQWCSDPLPMSGQNLPRPDCAFPFGSLQHGVWAAIRHQKNKWYSLW